MNFKICQNNKGIIAVLKDIAESLRIIAGAHHASGIQVKEFKLMIFTTATQPDTPFQIKPEFTDAEGNPIADPKGVTYEATSTDDAVVSIIPDPNGDPTKGTAHFGTVGQATLNFNILVKGKLVGALATSFTLVAGDPDVLSGGKVVFDGLEDI